VLVELKRACAAKFCVRIHEPGRSTAMPTLTKFALCPRLRVRLRGLGQRRVRGQSAETGPAGLGSDEVHQSAF
jgi:hypothetical protein